MDLVVSLYQYTGRDMSYMAWFSNNQVSERVTLLASPLPYKY